MTDDIALEDLPQPAEEGPVETASLETDGENPNEMSDEQFGLLCDRMRQNGWLGGAIITDTDGLIADGEHRWRAAQEIGLAEVPVKQYDIDDATRRLFRQELNKIHGEHDAKRDALEYDYLLDAGKSEEVTELTDAAGEDLDDLLAEIRVDNSMRPAYEYDPEHDVYFEDCVEGMQTRLEDNSVDMVFTSPPYNVEKEGHKDRTETEAVAYEDNKTTEEFRELIGTVASELVRVTKDTGHIFINLDPQYGEGYIESHEWLRNAVPAPLRSVIIWKKTRIISLSSPTRGNSSAITSQYIISRLTRPKSRYRRRRVSGTFLRRTPMGRANTANTRHRSALHSSRRRLSSRRRRAMSYSIRSWGAARLQSRPSRTTGTTSASNSTSRARTSRSSSAVSARRSDRWRQA